MDETSMKLQTGYADSAAKFGAGHVGVTSLLATSIRLVGASGESGKLLWLVAGLVTRGWTGLLEMYIGTDRFDTPGAMPGSHQQVDFVSFLQQSPSKVCSDKSCCPGDDHALHGSWSSLPRGHDDLHCAAKSIDQMQALYCRFKTLHETCQWIRTKHRHKACELAAHNPAFCFFDPTTQLAR